MRPRVNVRPFGDRRRLSVPSSPTWHRHCWLVLPMPVVIPCRNVSTSRLPPSVNESVLSTSPCTCSIRSPVESIFKETAYNTDAQATARSPTDSQSDCNAAVVADTSVDDAGDGWTPTPGTRVMTSPSRDKDDQDCCRSRGSPQTDVQVHDVQPRRQVGEAGRAGAGRSARGCLGKGGRTCAVVLRRATARGRVRCHRCASCRSASDGVSLERWRPCSGAHRAMGGVGRREPTVPTGMPSTSAISVRSRPSKRRSTSRCSLLGGQASVKPRSS